jgi:uncharacterized protein YndB with AHSA1/START domain
MKKLLKIGGIVIGALLILFFGVALFLPSEMSVTVSESIHAPPERVFDLTNDLRVFTGWISWGEDHLDSTLKLEFSDPAVGEGAWYRWTSEESGEGTTTIAESVRPERIRMAIEFEQGKMAVTNKFRFASESGGEGTRVEWELYMDDGGHLVHRYFLPIMEAMVGPFLAEGLTDLKKIAESAPAPAPEAPTPDAPTPEEVPEEL